MRETLSAPPSLRSSMDRVERPGGGREGKDEGEGGRRRERWYVRRIASAFWVPRRFGLPSKGLCRAVPRHTASLTFFPPFVRRRHPFLPRRLSISNRPRVSRSPSWRRRRRRRRRYLQFRASVSFVGLTTLSRSPGSCRPFLSRSHWRQQS